MQRKEASSHEVQCWGRSREGAAYAEGYEHFNLLESLEDLVDQLGRGKCSDEDVLEILNNIVNHNADGWTKI